MTQYSSHFGRLAQTVLVGEGLYNADPSLVARFYRNGVDLPHYLIDESVRDLLRDTPEAVRGTLLAPFRESSPILPFPEILLEMPWPGNARVFALLKQLDDGVSMLVGCLDRGAFHLADCPFKIHATPEHPTRWRITVMRDSRRPKWQDERLAKFGTAVMKDIWAFALGLHVRGVAQEKIEAPEKLNKARARKGKPPIREFTVMRIGQVYDKTGKTHNYTGRAMPVHLRAGHSRRQHYGRGNQLVKTVQIPPTIVNFTPGAEVKMPKRVLTVGQNVAHKVPNL